MNVIKIPTEQELVNNFTKWKEFHKILESQLKKVEYLKDLEEYKKNAIITIENLFKAHVFLFYPLKTFNPDKVQIDPLDINSSYGLRYYTYDYDGVYIYYYGRICIKNIDLDYHTDIRIIVDGTKIYEKI